MTNITKRFGIIFVLIAVMTAFNVAPIFAASAPAKAVKGTKKITMTKEVTMDAGATKVLTAKVNKAQKKGLKVTWKSSDSKIVAVKGKNIAKKKKSAKATITAKASGTATITAKIKLKNGKTKTAKTKVIVKEKPELKAISEVSINKIEKPVVKSTLSARMATKSDKVTYQWYRVTVKGVATPIEGATNDEYVTKRADLGYFIRVVATGDESQGYTGTSKATTINVIGVMGGGEEVELGYNTNSKLWTEDEVSKVMVGDTITVVGYGEEAYYYGNRDYMDITGVADSIQWMRMDKNGDWVAIEGATDDSYTVTDEDVVLDDNGDIIYNFVKADVVITEMGLYKYNYDYLHEIAVVRPAEEYFDIVAGAAINTKRSGRLDEENSVLMPLAGQPYTVEIFDKNGFIAEAGYDEIIFKIDGKEISDTSEDALNTSINTITLPATCKKVEVIVKYKDHYHYYGELTHTDTVRKNIAIFFPMITAVQRIDIDSTKEQAVVDDTLSPLLNENAVTYEATTVLTFKKDRKDDIVKTYTGDTIQFTKDEVAEFIDLIDDGYNPEIQVTIKGTGNFSGQVEPWTVVYFQGEAMPQERPDPTPATLDGEPQG